MFYFKRRLVNSLVNPFSHGKSLAPNGLEPSYAAIEETIHV